MKTNWTTNLVSELIRAEKEIDPNAETVAEICETTGAKRSATEIRLRKLVSDGTVEQVWKSINGRTCKAYRLKRHEKETVAKNSRRS